MPSSPQRPNSVITQAAQNTLDGRRVLLVHEDAFFAAYLADVIKDKGATVVATFSSAAESAASLERDPAPCALVLSTAVHDNDVIIRTAAAHGVATLLVQPARGAAPQPECHCLVLTAPYAGFQVVDALHRLLMSKQMTVRPLHGPQLRGH